MVQIGITGGKGGTGKSTVSVLLANKFIKKGKKVILCDCDVECPNDHLLLGQNLKNPVEKVHTRFPELDPRKCRKCSLCVKNCRSKAIFQAPGKYPVFLTELCSGCSLCWHLCPQGAIKVKRKIIGEIFKNKISENFYLVSGRSVGVVEETSPIVTRARDYVSRLAQRIKPDYLLFDTSVGIHCGVIRGLVGVDFAYAVTEPTPLGAHDLRLILELLKTIRVPVKIILNQADLGNKELISKISKDANIKIEYEIPHSKKLVQAYSKGDLKEVDIL